MKKEYYWDEKWKPISFDGINIGEIYEISNYGRLRRFKKEIDDWKILKPAVVKGYMYYSFKSDIHWTKKITKCLHRIVAEKFCEQPSSQHKYVIHLDYNNKNNYYKNLKWVTQFDVAEHQKDNPNYVNSRPKGLVTNSKLTETDVIRLKKKLKRGNNRLYKLAKEFGITHTQLNRIRSGENWGHIKVD